MPPERIGFTSDLAEGLAFWQRLHDALDALWLDSGEYEAWARARLEDPAGRVNVTGLALVNELNNYRRTYYWWFQDESADNFVPPAKCPRCSAGLSRLFRHLVCEACSIVVSQCGKD